MIGINEIKSYNPSTHEERIKSAPSLRRESRLKHGPSPEEGNDLRPRKAAKPVPQPEGTEGAELTT